ncbi:kinesin-like protein KIN-12E [Citrus sinensis]|uniref:Kinesin-like protein KIN-12E n=1 Tax=Citrus sinensis TaxID=2711 RepID=A0ACB8IR01_CITSI|nr:kinesin-like protein KIN-12E [Citrus sinensis]
MPFISETASAIKSRFGFHSRSTSSDSAPSFFTSPDLSLKSVSRDNHPGQSLAATSAVRSIGDWDDNAAAAATASSHSFEFSDDPSFWKDHNVQVIIRIRPLSRSEISVQGYNKCIRQESCQTITWTGHPESRFTFDIVADENVSQERLFKAAGVPMVDNCMGGYNSCMFAYGQTGSGKTHTMLGDIEESTQRHSVNSGMTPRVFEYLFSTIQKEKIVRKDEKIRFNCKCSFLEIYNEQILDLLDPSSSNLQIREDNKKGVYVENLKEIEVTSARDVIQQLIQGAANRKVAATNMNRASSRSHSVFTCIIESKWESQGVTHHRFARLNLVDLAGSERQKSSGAEGERLKEATNINKSLSTLGLVIMNLVSISNGKSLHVPYRDSKLTFLLQDSLGGNSKTIIIANISPSSCCSLETLSTLKFAQRAKFIKNNAIVNEDASGDVIAMRMEIQQLKKEVSRLRGIAHGGAESLVNDSPTVSFPGSPGSIKWEGLHESFSPLISDKRMSQKKDYELALVGAFRREKEKDISLQALVAENQAALRLLLEALDWKLMHESDSSAVQKANSVAVTEACSDGDLLISSKEPGSPWRTSVNEENEFLRMQAIHNQAEMETLRKQLEFSLEEKEKLERHVSDLVKQLEEQTCPISAKEETQEFQLSTNVPTINFDDQVELKTMVDAIAVASQREAEAHQTAIGLSKMHDELTLELEVLNKEKSEFNKLNDELQLKHKVLIEEKSNLIELYERKEMEMKREAENLELQLAEMHEENEKLLGLYEKAMQERDEFKRMISLCGQNRAEASGEIYCPEKLVEIDGGKQHITSVEPGLPALNGQDRRENSRFENLKSGENISRMDVHNGFSLYPGNSQANKETHISSQVEGLHSSEKTPGSAEAAFADMETEQLNLANIKVTEDLNLVRLKLEKAQEKLSDSANTITLFGSVEKAFAEVDKLSGDIVAMEDSIQAKQQQCGSLKHLCSEMQERKALVDNKLMALKYSLSSFSSSAAYFEQRAARSRARVTTSSTYLNQKKEQLVHLECCKREIEDALGKVQRSEAELRNNLALLKSKLEEENRRQENEKVLFAIDNIEKVDHPQRNWNLGGKATELLKSEEEKTKLQTELKLCRERLGVVKREFEDLTKKSWKIDSDLQTVQMEIQKSSRSVEEMELAHQAVLQEQEALLEIREKGKTEIESMILEYMQHVFEADLKEAEMRIVEEELQLELRRMDELRVLRAAAAEKKAQLLEHTKSKSCLFSEKMQEELKNVWSYLFEAKSLLV